MTLLGDHISVRRRYARSANLERDANRPEPLDGYIVTARALDAVERIAATAADGPSGGAWSLTGPYGSGKSSLALLLSAMLGPAGTTRENAWKLIDEASRPVGELIRRIHQRHRTHANGIHRGMVTANRESISHTILRALHTAVLCSYGDIPPASRFHAANTLRGALADAAADDPRRTGPSATALVEIAKCLAEDAPLLLIVDEFGKNLEAIRDSNGGDPYLLQQLAEAGQGSGLPIFMLTLQHLSFGDYLASTDGTRRREWSKVQGRFEDIAYVDSASETRALIGSVFEVRTEKMSGRIARWAQSQAKKMRSLGIGDLANPELVASCYPLQPLTAAVLPELCNRYGQHERTLFSFLTSRDSKGAASFLENTKLPNRGPLPSVGIESVYDYFVGNGTSVALSAGQSSRWTEIVTRLRDVHGLSRLQTRLAKSIALLNLVSTNGTIRASRELLSHTGLRVDKNLSDLVNAGLVTYRDFADEYRIWQGTDVDVRHLLDTARKRLQRRPLVEILSAIDQPLPRVAARHSAEHDVLRVFARRYVDGSEDIEPLDAFSSYDGEVLLVVGADRQTPNLVCSSPAIKPIIAAIPNDLAAMDRAAREVAAITAALNDPDVETDWVARRELGERLAQTQVAFDHAISSTFSADACQWILLGASGHTKLPAGRGSAALSAAADRAYSATPMVRNEMLNRTALTSQGAKARRLLLEAMIERGSEQKLGLEGYGPEVAMYRGFLERTGLHKWDADDEIMVFGRPADGSLQPAWQVLEGEFTRAKTRRINLNDIYATLLSPPIGMKAAVIPVFVTAALLAFRDEIAIYEHGTFKPLFTSDLSERMVRNPGHFEIKHFSNTAGARSQVVQALADRLGVRPGFRKYRVANVLAVVGHLVSRVRNLENYTLRTRNLTSDTLKARDTLVAAVEPDELLFNKLPRALGFWSVAADTQRYEQAEAYAQRISDALAELTECYRLLLTDLFDLLLETSAETTRRAISGQAAALENEVLNPSVRAFILTLANESMENDLDWIKVIATVIAKKVPAEWTDSDLLRFRHQLPNQVAAFQRLVALHAAHRADGGGPFKPLRATFTRADGGEYVRLVSVDENQRRVVDHALDRTLEELTGILGSPHRAHKALLAVLGDRLFPDRANMTNVSHVTIMNKRGKYD